MRVLNMGFTVQTIPLLLLAVYCNAQAPLLFWTSKDRGLQAIDLNTSSPVPPSENMSLFVTVGTVDFNIRAHTAYFTDVDKNKIYSISNNGVQTFVEGYPTNYYDALALDWIHENLYWISINFIRVVKADGSCLKNLITENLDNPAGIAVDPKNRWLYWSLWEKNHPRIERCGLNGMHREIIIEDNVVMPSGLTIDHTDRRLYWVDTALGRISSSDLAGDNYRIVLMNHETIKLPFGLTILGEYLFWTELQIKSIPRIDNPNSVHRINKWTNALNTGEGKPEVTTVFKLESTPLNIAMHHISRQPIYVNWCAEAECSHLCLPTPTMSDETQPTFECVCPDDMHLSSPTQCAPNNLKRQVDNPANSQVHSCDQCPVLVKMNSSLLKQESIIDSLVLELEELKRKEENLRRRFGNQRKTMNTLRSAVASLQYNIVGVHDDSVMSFKRIKLLKRANKYRILSAPFKGRQVFSSKKAFNKIAHAKKSCASAGGKMIEMTYNELMDASPMLQKAGLPITWYWVGWTRTNDQSDWTFTNSGLPVGDVSWNKPVPRGAKCARFHPGSKLVEAEHCGNHNIPVLCTLS